jgi:FtsH-binding integral membrane protein
LPADAHAQNIVWSRATTVFALVQALAGYGYSYLFAQSGGDHRLLMGVGALALAMIILSNVAKKVLAKPGRALL